MGPADRLQLQLARARERRRRRVPEDLAGAILSLPRSLPPAQPGPEDPADQPGEPSAGGPSQDPVGEPEPADGGDGGRGGDGDDGGDGGGADGFDGGDLVDDAAGADVFAGGGGIAVHAGLAGALAASLSGEAAPNDPVKMRVSLGPAGYTGAFAPGALGAAWLQHAGGYIADAGGVARISGGGSSGVRGYALLAGQTFADVDVSIDVDQGPGTGLILARSADDPNTYSAGVLFASVVRIRETIAGSGTTVASSSTTIADGRYTLRVRGGTFSVYDAADTLLVSHTFTSIVGSGRVGFGQTSFSTGVGFAGVEISGA